MKILVTPILPDSQGFRVWLDRAANDAPEALGEAYHVVGVYEPVGPDTCRIGYTMGDLSNDVNIGLGLQAYELGYRYLAFHVKQGTKVSRHAEFLRSDSNFDYYRTDLEAAIARVLGNEVI